MNIINISLLPRTVLKSLGDVSGKNAREDLVASCSNQTRSLSALRHFFFPGRTLPAGVMGYFIS